MKKNRKKNFQLPCYAARGSERGSMEQCVGAIERGIGIKNGSWRRINFIPVLNAYWTLNLIGCVASR